jgi:alpha-N-acetylglucosamine transferase
MKVETQIVNGYWKLLSNLNPKTKLKLIEKLSKSISFDNKSNEERFDRSFGAWIDSRDVDEIISEIRDSRVLNRQIESF